MMNVIGSFVKVIRSYIKYVQLCWVGDLPFLRVSGASAGMQQVMSQAVLDGDVVNFEVAHG